MGHEELDAQYEVVVDLDDARRVHSRPRDEIWDALEDAFGKVRTPTERGRRNRAVRELREAEATPEEIRITVDYCRRHFSSWTEMAVCGWLSRALQERKETDNVRDLFERMRR